MAAITTRQVFTIRAMADATRGGVLVLLILLLTGCNHVGMMFHDGAERPAQSEFGFGPRTSASGAYMATIEPEEPFRVRRLQTLKLTVRTQDGSPVENAAIEIDGGMPEHGHGLPTQPKVTSEVAAGTYQVEGVRFNMGGWWELKFRVSAAEGRDSVVFNLDL